MMKPLLVAVAQIDPAWISAFEDGGVAAHPRPAAGTHGVQEGGGGLSKAIPVFQGWLLADRRVDRLGGDPARPNTITEVACTADMAAGKG